VQVRNGLNWAPEPELRGRAVVNNNTKSQKINMTDAKNLCSFIVYCQTKYKNWNSTVSTATRLQAEQFRF